MVKNKQKISKTPKKRSTKYSKLAAVCSKELTAKKAALVRAEKALAKAQKTHAELLSDVARLDMLDRSLKALINGTEPPQNVRYVYNYPQWVWYGNPYGGNTWTVTLGQTTPNYTGNWQGGMYSNSINTTPGINTTTGTFTTSGSLISNTVDSNMIGCNSSGITYGSTTAAGPGLNSLAFSTASSVPQSELTIDLSTHAEEECKGTCEPACEKCAVAVTTVGHGG